MGATILLEGSGLDPKDALALMRELAPIVMGRPLSLVEVEAASLPDANGSQACWTSTWRDGSVSLVAVVSNGDGNPRDGYGYGVNVTLTETAGGKTQWRAQMFGGSDAPRLAGPLRIGLFAPSPEAYEAARACAAALCSDHRDRSWAEPHAVDDTLSTFVCGGHEAWVREWLARPLGTSGTVSSARLAALKHRLRGPDRQNARVWLSHDRSAAVAYRMLAELGGDEQTSAADARLLAALAHPWGPSWLGPAIGAHPLAGAALREAMAHVFSDPHFRAVDPADVAPLAEDPRWRDAAPSRRVTWVLPRLPEGHVIDALVAAVVGFPSPAPLVMGGPSPLSGPPLAAPGSLPSTYGIGTGHSVRRALLAPSTPVETTRAFASYQANCEDRIARYGLVWLGSSRQVVWKSSLALEGGVAVLSALAIEVIDRGDGSWGRALEEQLHTRPPR